MEDSEVVFEELRDTAEVMEREGLLPDGHNEKMELGDTQFQDGTCPKSREFDISSEEGLDAAGGGIRHNVMVHSEELSDLCPEDKFRKEEEFETPHVGGIHGEGKAFRRMDLRIGYLIWVRCRTMWRHSEWFRPTGSDQAKCCHR